jgi:hypothetical protein
MKRQPPTKPRATALTMDMGKPIAITRVDLNANGTFQFYDANGYLVNPVSAFVERSYDRPKGPKVLSQVPVDPSVPMTADPLQALLAYDVIYVIDSNSRVIRDQNISVAAAILAKWQQREPEIRLGFAAMHALEFRDTDCHPDLLALRYHLHLLENNPTIGQAGKIALVVDSHLDNLSAIRSGNAPVLDDCYLPSWADLIYASDSAQDTLVNMLLRQADKEASALLKLIEDKTFPDMPSEDMFGHAKYFRFWRTNNSG